MTRQIVDADRVSSAVTVSAAEVSLNNIETPMTRADLSLIHALLGHYARMLWDIQKVRIAMGNRVAAMERDGLPEEWALPIKAYADDLLKSEKGMDAQLKKLAKRHFLAAWIEAQPGIGLPGFARLMGVTGPLDNFATVSKLWRYVGMAVDNGEAPRRRKGERLNYSPQGRVLCHQLGEAIVKVGRGPYREAYSLKKAEYEVNHADWTPLHRHNAAMRYAVKMLLKEMWKEWRRAA